MTTPTDTLEEELRALYTAVPTPEPRIGALAKATNPATRPAGWHVGPGRIVAVAAIAASVIAGTVITRRGAIVPTTPVPTTPAPASRLTVAVLPPGANLTCTIAMSALSDARATGFIHFVAGRGTFQPVATSGNTYVTGLGRWVETTPQMVAPDGSGYVTADGDLTHTRIVVVDSTGPHTVYTANRGWLSPLGYSPLGIVLLDTTPGTTGPPPSMPISLLDPRTGTVRHLPVAVDPRVQLRSGNGSSTGYEAGTDSVWMQTYDSSSKLSVVNRFDLATGRTTTWYDGRIDGSGDAQPVGETGNGQLIVQVAGSDLEHIAPTDRAGIDERTLLMTAPHTIRVLNAGVVGTVGVADSLSPLSAIDGDVVWLAGDDGTLWRYSPVDGLQAMAAIRTTTDGAPGVSISGPCR